jgi:hypothetical protein
MMTGSFEQICKNNLRVCAKAYADSKKLQLTTLGRIVAADSPFFTRLSSNSSFTIRKYDEVMRWFSANWPDDLPWPEGVGRPRSGSSETGAAA